MSIGIFDSGVGGLTVFQSISQIFPQVDIYYLGDSARVPYGNKSKETIIRYSLECASYLYERFRIDVLVVACNTASSYALEVLKNYFDIPVIGVVEPGVEAALEVSTNRKVGVIGTYATINSNSYRSEILKRDCNVDVYQKPCPLFVPLVEEGMIEHPVTYLMVKEYLQELVDFGIDTLILGCTHYPLLKDTISSVYPNLKIVDSSKAIIDKIKPFCSKEEKGTRRIFFTDLSSSFKKFEKLLLADSKIEKIELSELCKI
ncbi:MAG: glutamate racemase [Aquificae bacterium]|nr:glutamate racemase [Aquificota bacterium]